MFTYDRVSFIQLIVDEKDEEDEYDCRGINIKVQQMVHDCSSINIGGLTRKYWTSPEEATAAMQAFLKWMLDYRAVRYSDSKKGWRWKLAFTSYPHQDLYDDIFTELRKVASKEHEIEVKGWHGDPFYFHIFEVEKNPKYRTGNLVLPEGAGKFRVKVSLDGSVDTDTTIKVAKKQADETLKRMKGDW